MIDDDWGGSRSRATTPPCDDAPSPNLEGAVATTPRPTPHQNLGLARSNNPSVNAPSKLGADQNRQSFDTRFIKT
ncbi:hypothetical protein BAU14_07540 [Enterococcus sp. CU9D]|nr:hypothetical protein BAU14_07540 [Enterococcus sp. CU9D]